jgi:hypothetical protein
MQSRFSDALSAQLKCFLHKKNRTSTSHRISARQNTKEITAIIVERVLQLRVF